MKKIKLEIETLEIVSFETTPAAANEGTVIAHDSLADYATCATAQYDYTCVGFQATCLAAGTNGATCVAGFTCPATCGWAQTCATCAPRETCTGCWVTLYDTCE